MSVVNNMAKVIQSNNMQDVIKEETSKGIYRICSESFKTESNDSGVKLSGDAMPFNETSRNKVKYIRESVEKAKDSLNNVSLLWNHDFNNVIGHVTNAGMNDTHLTYEADIDPEESYVLRKLERGDVKHVSIHAMIDEDNSYVDDEGIIHAWVKEFIELSVVPVPGFADTTAILTEKLGGNMTKNKEKEEQEKQDTQPEESNEPYESTEQEGEDEDDGKDLNEVVAELQNKINELESRIQVIEEKEDEEESEEEESDSSEPSHPDKDKDDEEEEDVQKTEGVQPSGSSEGLSNEEQKALKKDDFFDALEEVFN